MNRVTCYAIVLICLIVPALSLQAQKAPAPAAAVAAADVNTTICVYDVRDICSAAIRPQHESTLLPATQIGLQRSDGRGGGGGGGGGGFGQGGAPQVQATDTQKAVDDLSNLIKETVDRESWVDNGGKLGSARYFNGMFVVGQSAANHTRIAELLKQIRAESARMVRIRAIWASLSPADLAIVLVKDKAGKGISALQEVDPAALEELVKNRPPTRGQITCFNGQSVALSSGRAHSIILNVEPVVGQSGVVAYTPVMQTVRDGVDLRLTPTISPEGDLVTVHLGSIYSEWPAAVTRAAGSTTRPVVDVSNAAAASVAGLAMVDPIDMLVQDFSTTARIPAGRMVLISGTTLAPGTAQTRTEQMFLILEATPIK